MAWLAIATQASVAASSAGARKILVANMSQAHVADTCAVYT